MDPTTTTTTTNDPPSPPPPPPQTSDEEASVTTVMFDREDLKKIACVVFFPCRGRDNCSIYLIHVPTGKLINYLDLAGKDYPSEMGYVVHKSKLYMFGGVREDDDCCNDTGCPDAFVLDLFELGNTRADEQKPLPTKLPPMNCGKRCPFATVVGDKICVYDVTLGHQPPNGHIELFDPKHWTWEKIPDPYSPLLPGLSLHAYVEDEKLFVSIDDLAVFKLYFGVGATTPYVWDHLDEFHGTTSLRGKCQSVKIGSLVLSLRDAFDLDGEGFAEKIPVQGSGYNVVKGWDVNHKMGSAVFIFGHNKVCTVQCGRRPPSKIHHTHVGRMIVRLKKRWALQPVLYKCRRKKNDYRFLINVCEVDPAVRPINLKVLWSFAVPMYFVYDEDLWGYMCASLCDF